jgi:hypothetical protein
VTRGIVVKEQEPLVKLLRCFLSKCTSIATARMSNIPRCYFGPLEDNPSGECRFNPKRSRPEILQDIFALGIFVTG